MSRTLRATLMAAVLSAGAAAADAPSVAADIAPVHALVARVMEGVGAPGLVIPAGATPHAHTLRPSEARALQNADVVFWVGPALTPWLADAISTLAPSAEAVALLGAGGSKTLAFRQGALFEADDHHRGDDDGEDSGHDADHAHADDGDGHAGGETHDGGSGAGRHDHGDDPGHDAVHAHVDDGGSHADGEMYEGDARADGHDHGGTDPHAWLDPYNAAAWLGVISDALGRADPDNAGRYAANAAAARAETAALADEIARTLDPVRGRGFIVFHDAFQYFEAAFDVPAAGAISLGDAARPGPARIAGIRARLAGSGVACVLAEPQFDPGLVRTVMDGTPARTAVADPLGAGLTPGPTLYPALMRNLAVALADCL